MTAQIHNRLRDEQVGMIFSRYVNKEISTEQAMDLLGLKRRQFFEWLKRYKENGNSLTIAYARKGENRRISEELEEDILSELRLEKTMINDPAIPVRFYNYSYVQDQLRKKYGQKVSLPTIIDRAKKTTITLRDPKRRCMTARY